MSLAATWDLQTRSKIFCTTGYGPNGSEGVMFIQVMMHYWLIIMWFLYSQGKSMWNTIQNIWKRKPHKDKYSRSGIYQMKCLDCPLKYVKQTGRTFKTRYKEHIHDIKSNNSNSGYSSHILNTGHTYGTITYTMKIITMGKKEKYLNTLEKYCNVFGLLRMPF
jgi:hypothetical protein